LTLDIPLNWTKTIEPQVIPKLDIDEEQRVNLKITPPADVSVGRYEVRLRTTGLSDNQPVNAEDKTAIMEIQAETSVIGTVLLVLLILGLVSRNGGIRNSSLKKIIIVEGTACHGIKCNV